MRDTKSLINLAILGFFVAILLIGLHRNTQNPSTSDAGTSIFSGDGSDSGSSSNVTRTNSPSDDDDADDSAAGGDDGGDD